MSARYEISEGELDVLAITGPEGTRYIDGEEIEARAIRQQSADIAALKDALADEVTANEAFRKAGGARDDEDMPAFCARLIGEAEIGRKWNTNSALEEWFPLTADCIKRDALELADTRLLLRSVQTQLANADAVLAELFPAAEALRAELSAAVAERDGIAIERDQARLTLREIAQILIEQIGSVGPENAINAALRACGVIESMATRLAAIDAAPTVALTFCHPYSHEEPGQLIARPAKD